MLAAEHDRGVVSPQSLFSEGDRPQLVGLGVGAADDRTRRPVVILVHVNQESRHSNAPFVERNYLRYFIKIYESKGWLSIQCTPSDNEASDGEECGRVVQSLMKSLESRGLHQNPMFLHLLGPGSVQVYNQITRAFSNEHHDVFQIRGTIIDSGPCRPSGIVTSFRKTFPTMYNIVITFLHILAFLFPELLNPPSKLDSYETFCYNQCASPQLFLYSSCDHVVNSCDVESAITVRHRAGVTVDKKCWSNSEHARHLFSHELEYTRLCQEFVEKIIIKS